MRTTFNVWTLAAACFGLGLPPGTPTAAVGDTDCEKAQNHTIPGCLDDNGNVKGMSTCWCVACSDRGHSCSDDDYMGTCTAWEADSSGGGRWVQVDTYNCWIEGSCSCAEC